MKDDLSQLSHEQRVKLKELEKEYQYDISLFKQHDSENMPKTAFDRLLSLMIMDAHNQINETMNNFLELMGQHPTMVATAAQILHIPIAELISSLLVSGNRELADIVIANNAMDLHDTILEFNAEEQDMDEALEDDDEDENIRLPKATLTQITSITDFESDLPQQPKTDDHPKILNMKDFNNARTKSNKPKPE